MSRYVSSPILVPVPLPLYILPFAWFNVQYSHHTPLDPPKNFIMGHFQFHIYCIILYGEYLQGYHWCTFSEIWYEWLLFTLVYLRISVMYRFCFHFFLADLPYVFIYNLSYGLCLLDPWILVLIGFLYIYWWS